MKALRQLILCGALLAASELISPCAEGPNREECVLVTLTASIEAIDLGKREATLKGHLGNSTTLTVDPKSCLSW